uniref:NADH dehydrogenase subunit 4L n=1 Tax=Cacopsylla melanoneura TaxID=428564 RepID=A0A8D9FEU3_9HEMI
MSCVVCSCIMLLLVVSNILRVRCSLFSTCTLKFICPHWSLSILFMSMFLFASLVGTASSTYNCTSMGNSCLSLRTSIRSLIFLKHEMSVRLNSLLMGPPNELDLRRLTCMTSAL